MLGSTCSTTLSRGKQPINNVDNIQNQDSDHTWCDNMITSFKSSKLFIRLGETGLGSVHSMMEWKCFHVVHVTH